MSIVTFAAGMAAGAVAAVVVGKVAHSNAARPTVEEALMAVEQILRKNGGNA